MKQIESSLHQSVVRRMGEGEGKFLSIATRKSGFSACFVACYISKRILKNGKNK